MMRSKIWLRQAPLELEIPFLVALKKVLVPPKPSTDAVQSA